ncbi:MAG: protein-L-isoaspartate O-methyltransferase [Candidatus Marinimicrobia bacterium]|nr:protein-L-isoaspartate O-methyltransferase [Candidatus Neomarinimicrobiota bacterium]|tara:strand:+ start:2331 stop:2942 length:612 start_codon:yes stop_codon:yes gene_type:complete
MIKQQLERRGISSTIVLEAMERVERHRFIPEDLRDRAYNDGPLPIGNGQTISQPYIVALMTEMLSVDREHKILEVGTGSGYQAAILAELSDDVHTIEIIPELVERAKKILSELEYNNITLYEGDGYQGIPKEAPFDRIIVTAAPEHIPEELVKQLSYNGIMILPVGPQFQTQYLWIIRKGENGKISKEKKIPVRFVPMVKDND